MVPDIPALLVNIEIEVTLALPLLTHETPNQLHTAKEEIGTPPKQSHPSTVDIEHMPVDTHRSHRAELWGLTRWVSYVTVSPAIFDTAEGIPPVRKLSSSIKDCNLKAPLRATGTAPERLLPSNLN